MSAVDFVDLEEESELELRLRILRGGGDRLMDRDGVLLRLRGGVRDVEDTGDLVSCLRTGLLALPRSPRYPLPLYELRRTGVIERYLRGGERDRDGDLRRRGGGDRESERERTDSGDGDLGVVDRRRTSLLLPLS